MAKEYDLVIIGGGIAGYTGALKAAKKGLNVAVVERDLLGGTCLNRGCIPTKAYLKSAEVVRTVKDSKTFGLNLTGDYQLNIKDVKKRKDGIVGQLRSGVRSLFKMYKVDYFEGEASVLGTSIFTPKSGSVMIKPNDGGDEIITTPKNVLIATGSRPSTVANIEIDEQKVLSSTGILEIEKLPKSISIIGGGVIGVEWASLLNDFGVEVTIIEFQDRLIVNESKKVSEQLKKEFTNRGIQINLETAVQSAKIKKDQVEIKAIKSGEEVTFTSDLVLMAVGRKPNIENIGLEAAGVEFDQRGIKVNDHFETTAENIYAVGDVINTLQLAHVAAAEAELVVDLILGEKITPMNYDQVPRGIYTYPEIASVGLTSGKTADDRGTKKGQFDFKFNGKSLIEGEVVGQAQIFTDSENDDFVGLSIVGPHATDLISEGSLGLYLNSSTEEISQTIHPHPTLSEVIGEAAKDTYGLSTNK